MEKLQSGDLVILSHKEKEGIGYIYDNGDTENPHLIIGISWKDGGTSNTTIFEAIADGVKFKKVTLDPVEKSHRGIGFNSDLDPMEIRKLEDAILSRFEEYGVDTDHQDFDLIIMSEIHEIDPRNLYIWLVNMEDSGIMEDIADGHYHSFDIDEKNYFGDSYMDLMSDYASRSFPFT
jgi:hypothetical protein